MGYHHEKGSKIGKYECQESMVESQGIKVETEHFWGCCVFVMLVLG